MDAKKFYEDQKKIGNLSNIDFLIDNFQNFDGEKVMLNELFFLMENYARLYHELNK